MNENLYQREQYFDLDALYEHFRKTGAVADVSEQNFDILLAEAERFLRYAREQVGKGLDEDCISISKPELLVWRPKAENLAFFTEFLQEKQTSFGGIYCLFLAYEGRIKNYLKLRREFVVTRDLGIFAYAALLTKVNLGYVGKALLEIATDICGWTAEELIPAVCQSIDFVYAGEWLLLNIYQLPEHQQKEAGRLIQQELLQRSSLTKLQIAVLRSCVRRDKKMQKLMYNVFQALSLFFLVAIAIPDLYIIAIILAVSLFCFYTFEVWKF